MRKVFAIVLLAIHLFNFGGYSLLFQVLIQQSDKQLTQKLDNNLYSKNDLVEVKIPLCLPYQISRNDYERFDGNISFGGVHYNYVMRKVKNDTLHILCIANHKKMRLCDAQNNYQKLVSDVPSNQQNGNSNLKKYSITVEYNIPAQYNLTVNITLLTRQNFVTSSVLHDCFITTNDQPPEV